MRPLRPGLPVPAWGLVIAGALVLMGSLVGSVALAPRALAQGAPEADPDGPGLRFNGLGRAYLQQTDLGGRLRDTDTTTVRALADGEFVLDLAVNAQPHRAVEVQGVLRLRNEFGGFFGSGVTVEVRELWARGIIADAVEYRLGDMDLALTPYTVFLPEPDGVVNPAAVFEPQLERIAYEAFYTGRNERRFQGGRLDVGLAFDRGLEAVDAQAFLARLRPTDFTTTPARYLGGGRLSATAPRVGPFGSQATAGLNLATTWDDLESGDVGRGIRNAVVTADADVALYERPALALALRGEVGRSVARYAERREEGAPEGDPDEAPLLRESDSFVEVGVEAAFRRRGLAVSATAVDVGPDFFSAAAQSRRVDVGRAPSLFTRLGNERDLRPVGLFDLTRDPAVYTYRVEEQLMRYDPRYANVLPYGRATPNRRGLRLGADYEPEGGPLTAGLLVALLREIRGQGTDELKDFALVRAEADLAVAPLVGYGRDLGLTVGAQLERTAREGDEFETVDLTSVLLEAGIAAEVYDRLDVLLGVSARASSGRDYVPAYENFNDVRDFPGPFVTDDRETLLGAGLRYRFGEGIYLTIQAQQYRYAADDDPDGAYRLGQVFALYSMSF